MPRKLAYQDMLDLISGATILGCGGGGDPVAAKGMVDEIFAKGKEFSLLDPKSLSEKAWVCIVGHLGGGIAAEEKDLVKDLPRVWEQPILVAEKELADYLGVEFDAYLPSEIGAGNTVTTMLVAALKGKPTLDGDAAGGRAKPEIIISTTYLAGIPITPLAITSHFGDSLILKKTENEDRVEKICRYLSRVSGGRVAIARCPSRGKEMVRAMHPYSVSLAIAAGKAVREEPQNPVGALLKVLKGTLRFSGRVESFSRAEKGGFMWGDIILQGEKEFKGETYKIWFKNENLIGWRGEKLNITCPDAIAIVDAQRGEGLTNWGDHFYHGRQVAVIGIPAAEMWKSQKGFEVFGPRHFGFDFPPETT